MGERWKKFVEITEFFKVERTIFVTMITVSLALLIACAVCSMLIREFRDAAKALEFVLGGTTALGASGLLFMWNRAINVVMLSQSTPSGAGGKQ
jgi:hypothetical protein